MRKKYNCMTAFLCLLIAFIGMSFISLFTIVEAKHIRNMLFDKVELEVSALADEMSNKYSKGSEDWDQIEQISEEFIEDINAMFKNDKGVTIGGFIGYYNGEGWLKLNVEDMSIQYTEDLVPEEAVGYTSYYRKNISVKDLVIQYWKYLTSRKDYKDFIINLYGSGKVSVKYGKDLSFQHMLFPTSGEATKIFNTYYYVIADKLFMDNIFLTAASYREPFLNRNCYCRMIFVVHPLEQVVKRNLQWYLLMIAVLIVFEWIIVRIRQKKFVGMRFRKLMDSTLTTGFSHELKTPLAILRASVENWDYIEDEDKPYYLEKVSEETKHLDQLIHKLTTIGEMKSEGTETDIEMVDLYSLMMESYERLKPLMNERKLEVEIVADCTKKYFVEGNPEMLRIAVNNYISNAVKYAKYRIVLELKEEKCAKKVRFNVTNDGAGLSKEETKKVWTLFFKKDQARTDRLGSSGVGLAVTKSILQLHKAKFGCGSNDRGTTFWFQMKKISKDEGEV